LNSAYYFSLSEISSNKRKDKNVIPSGAIMNMAESKPRPLPKPRVRHKYLPASTIQSTNVTPIVSSSAPKPPITKPKPAGYKQLEFNNKILVSIKADIDIGDESTANLENNGCKDNENFERNNNVANFKHGNGKGLIRNGLKDNKVSFFSEAKSSTVLLTNDLPDFILRKRFFHCVPFP
jgi:hypothetical protein